MAGNIKRPSLKDLKFDLKTIKFIKEYALQPKGDDKLLLSIVKFFEKEGFKFMNWKNECKDLFVYKDNFKKIFNKEKSILKNIENLDEDAKSIDEIKEMIDFIKIHIERGICNI